MASIESMTVGQIRDILVNQFGYDPDRAANIKGKSNLGIELMRLKYNVNQQESEETFIQKNEGKELFDSMERDTPSAENPIEALEDNIVYVPQIGSAEWEDYVKAHLLPNEYFEKNDKLYPKAVGLRRVAQVLLGEIVDSGPIREYAPADGGYGRATVVYQVVFHWMGDALDKRVFREAADAWAGNTPTAFAVHPVATASTRAEGRCFKKALQLNLYTAEEMIDDKDSDESVEQLSDGDFKDDTPITGAQISNINRMCEKHGIDLIKFLCNNYPNFIPNKSSPFDGLLSADGSSLCAKLNKYQVKGKDHLEIPEEIKVTSNDGNKETTTEA